MQLLDNIMFTHSSDGHLVVAASMGTALAQGLCDDAQHQYLWVVDSATRLGRVDVKSGKAEVIGRLGIELQEIGFDEQGRLLGRSGQDLYSINTNNAKLTFMPVSEATSGHQSSVKQFPRPERHTGGLFSVANSAPLLVEDSRANGINRTASELAFDLARLYMKLFSQEADNMVQLAVLDGRSMDIGVFGYGTIYGSARGNISLFQPDARRVYTTDSRTGNTTSVTDYSNSRRHPHWSSAVGSES